MFGISSSLIGKGDKDLVGVDIGTSAVKVVHLSEKSTGGLAFENFAIARLKEGSIQSSNKLILGKQIAKIINYAFEKSGIKCKSVSFSIPSFNSFISFITIPKSFEEELSSKIEIEARKYIPVPLSEVSLGWEIINDSQKAKSMGVEADEEKLKILLMAVSKDTIKKYETIAENSKLNLSSIEVESFSLIRALTNETKGTHLIMDIGSRLCNILVASDGFLRGSRNVDLGGGDISEAIARSLNVGFGRSESLKKEWGINNQQISSLIVPVLNRITQEAKRVVDAYNEKNPTRRIEKIFLVGGTSKLKGVKEYLRQGLNMMVEEGNPWQGIDSNKKEAQLLGNFKSELAVAIGLAKGGR